MIIFLFILNVFWSAAAWAYDFDKLKTIPIWLWPFVAVCPVFPLLLALVLLPLYRKKRPNQFLLSFASIPSALYGTLAILFYPTAMIYQGFSWNALGQIFWVLVYGIQGFWLLSKFRLSKAAFYSGIAFVIVQIVVVDLLLGSFSYFDFTNIPLYVLILIGLLAFLFFSIILEVLIKKR